MGIWTSTSLADEIHSFELARPSRKPTKRDALRAKFIETPLRVLDNMLEEFENYLDLGFFERIGYRWHHGGAPLSRAQYRVALEVYQQREQAERDKSKTLKTPHPPNYGESDSWLRDVSLN